MQPSNEASLGEEHEESYKHIVLTLPHEVNALLYAAPELRLERLKALGFQLIESA